MVLLLI